MCGGQATETVLSSPSPSLRVLAEVGVWWARVCSGWLGRPRTPGWGPWVGGWTTGALEAALSEHKCATWGLPWWRSG